MIIDIVCKPHPHSPHEHMYPMYHMVYSTTFLIHSVSDIGIPAICFCVYNMKHAWDIMIYILSFVCQSRIAQWCCCFCWHTTHLKCKPYYTDWQPQLHRLSCNHEFQKWLDKQYTDRTHTFMSTTVWIVRSVLLVFTMEYHRHKWDHIFRDYDLPAVNKDAVIVPYLLPLFILSFIFNTMLLVLYIIFCNEPSIKSASVSLSMLMLIGCY